MNETCKFAVLNKQAGLREKRRDIFWRRSHYAVSCQQRNISIYNNKKKNKSLAFQIYYLNVLNLSFIFSSIAVLGETRNIFHIISFLKEHWMN